MCVCGGGGLILQFVDFQSKLSLSGAFIFIYQVLDKLHYNINEMLTKYENTTKSKYVVLWKDIYIVI